MNKDIKKYYEAYYNNEYDANRHMTYALLFTAILLLLVWTGYLANAFEVTQGTNTLCNVVMPITALLLMTPMLYLKTDKIKRPRFKYFVLFNFIFAVSLLNIVIPKHAVLGYAACIMLTSHYYNPKVCKIVFFTTLIMMLLCLYASVFLGEFDSNLLMGQLDENYMIRTPYLDGAYPDTPQGRFEYLHALKEVGYNRYIKIFFYYFLLSRALILVILFFVINSLNKRTYKLLIDEIHINSEQEKTLVELDVASTIQLQTLAKEFVSNKEIEIQAELKPARSVGGDFYDYYILDDDHVAILIGDVSGKGIGAAMFMMSVITCFKDIASVKLSPAETLKKVNKAVYSRNSAEMFVTCFYAIINTKTGHMRYANAGHTRPVIGTNYKFHYLKCRTGFILGVMDDISYVDEEYQMQNGEMITLYTDGITEAKNEAGELYGERRLLEVFNHHDYSCLVELLATIKDSISSFTNDIEQTDDITYLTLRYHGDEYVYEEKTFKGEKDQIPLMLNFIKGFCSKYHFDKGFNNNALIIGDELLSNIVKYGYAEKEGNVYIRCLYNLDKKEFILTIIDTGIQFNPFMVKENAIGEDANVDELKEGGLGILIVKKLMSQYAYDRINDKNIVILRKTF